MSRVTGRLLAACTGITGTGAAASIGLALLVFTCTFIAAFLPRASMTSQTSALQKTLATDGQLAQSVTATATVLNAANIIGVAGISGDWPALADTVRSAGLPVAPLSAGWAGLTTTPIVSQNGLDQLELAYRTTLARNVRLVAGTLPTTAVRGKSVTIVQVALTRTAAAGMHVRLGSTLRMDDKIDLTVTAIVRPANPAAAFWTYDPTLVTYSATGLSGAFIGAGEVNTVQGDLQRVTVNGLPVSQSSVLSWNFPLRLGGLTASQAPVLLSQLQPVVRPSGSPAFSSQLGSVLTAFIATDEGINTVLAFLFVSLTVLGLIVVLQGARLLSEHRETELAIMRARGASLGYLCWLALRSGALVAVPAAAAATAVAMAIRPGSGAALEWKVAALIAAITIVGLPVTTLRRQLSQRPARPGRAPSPRALAARRWIADGTLIVIAAGALIELRQLGPPPGGGINLYTSAAPAIAAIPAAVIAMRLYPVLLRWLLRLTRRRRGVTLFVGFARGERAALSTALPVFALVLALAIIGFGATLRAAVQRGDVLASWQDIGADAVITGQSGAAIPAGLQKSVRAVPGVQRTATAVITTGAADGSYAVPVVILDPARYGALVAGTPAPPFPAAALARPDSPRTVPVLVSSSAQSLLDQTGDQVAVDTRDLNVRVAGVISALAVIPGGGTFIVVPSWAVPAAAPNAMAVVGPGLDGAALTAVVRHAPAPAPALQLRSAQLATLANAPLPRSAYFTSLLGLAATVCFSLLSLLLALVLGARSRALTQARLATMGISRRQARQLGIAESVPAIVVAAAGGTACVAILIPLVAPAISLSAFTGSGIGAPFRTDPLVLAGSAVALVALAVVTIIIQVAMASHRGAARQLRVGE
jgi:putative ABC transport system permease protein